MSKLYIKTLEHNFKNSGSPPKKTRSNEQEEKIKISKFLVKNQKDLFYRVDIF